MVSNHSRAAARSWPVERYGDVAHASWWSDYGDGPWLLNAGGADLSALELFGDRLRDVRYLGVDVSEVSRRCAPSDSPSATEQLAEVAAGDSAQM